MQPAFRLWMVVAATAASLALAPMAIAATESTNANQSPGVTSGPATNSTTVPNTAVEKHNGSTAAAGVGAPGMAAKPGSESGQMTNQMQTNQANQSAQNSEKSQK